MLMMMMMRRRRRKRRMMEFLGLTPGHIVAVAVAVA
jgi:hypothetical protein